MCNRRQRRAQVIIARIAIRGRNYPGNARAPRCLVVMQRAGNRGLLQALGQLPRIFQRHIRALRHEGQRGMCRITQYRRMAPVPVARDRMAKQPPQENLPHLRQPFRDRPAKPREGRAQVFGGVGMVPPFGHPCAAFLHRNNIAQAPPPAADS